MRRQRTIGPRRFLGQRHQPPGPVGLDRWTRLREVAGGADERGALPTLPRRPDIGTGSGRKPRV